MMAFHVYVVHFFVLYLLFQVTPTFNCQLQYHNILEWSQFSGYFLSLLVIVVLKFHIPLPFVLARHNPVYSTDVARIFFSLVVCDIIFPKLLQHFLSLIIPSLLVCSTNQILFHSRIFHSSPWILSSASWYIELDVTYVLCAHILRHFFNGCSSFL